MEAAVEPGIAAGRSMRQWGGGAGGATFYYATAVPRNVLGLFNASNSVVNRYRYQAFVQFAEHPDHPRVATDCRRLHTNLTNE